MAINLKNYDPALMQGAEISISSADVSIDDLTVADDATISGDLAVTGTLAVTSTSAFTGVVSGLKSPAAVVTANTVLAATDSGKLLVDNQNASTTTFTLPDAGTTQGITFTFVCSGADGEILINPAAGDKIAGKTHGAENGTGIAPAAGTGIKNTAATNVKGDFVTLVFDGVDTWWMTAVAGVWASQ